MRLARVLFTLRSTMLSLVLLAPASLQAQHAVTSDSGTVVITEGEGATHALALRAALSDAVARVAGVVITSRTEVSGEIVTRDDLASFTSGHVLDYTVVRRDSIPGGVRVFVTARVSAIDRRTSRGAQGATVSIPGDKAIGIAAFERDQGRREATIVHRLFASGVERPSVYDMRLRAEAPVVDGDRTIVPLSIERVANAHYTEEIATLRLVLGALAGREGITQLKRGDDGRWVPAREPTGCRAPCDAMLLDVTRALVPDDSFPLRDPLPASGRIERAELFPTLREAGGFVVAIVDADERELTAYRVRTTAAFTYLSSYAHALVQDVQLSLSVRADTSDRAARELAGAYVVLRAKNGSLPASNVQRVAVRGKLTLTPLEGAREHVRGGPFAPRDFRSPYVWLTITDRAPGTSADTLRMRVELPTSIARAMQRIDVVPLPARVDLPAPACPATGRRTRDITERRDLAAQCGWLRAARERGNAGGAQNQ